MNFYQNPNSNECVINRFSGSGRQPSGGVGRHTTCKYISTDKIKPNLLGTVSARSKAPGSHAKGPILPQLNECQLILQALADARAYENDNITIYDYYNPTDLPPTNPSTNPQQIGN